MGGRLIGVDVGGTRTKLVLLELPGTVVDSRNIDSRCDTPARLAEAIAAAAADWIGERPGPAALGVAVPGLVDRRTGRVLRAPNLQLLDGFNICETLHRATGLDVELDNDANAAGLAEARLGAAAGCDSAVCVTVGTGVGGAIIHEGRLWRGHCGTAGEIGRLLLDADTTRYFEQDIGAAAVVRAYRALSAQEVPDADSAEVARRAQDGDAAARQALARCGARLGVGLAIVVNLFNPELIVVGGGVAGAGDWFLGPARAEGERRAWSHAWKHCRVVSARLGGRAGAIGAALLVEHAAARG